MGQDIYAISQYQALEASSPILPIELSQKQHESILLQFLVNPQAKQPLLPQSRCASPSPAPPRASRLAMPCLSSSMVGGAAPSATCGSPTLSGGDGGRARRDAPQPWSQTGEWLCADNTPPCLSVICSQPCSSIKQYNN